MHPQQATILRVSNVGRPGLGTTLLCAASPVWVVLCMQSGTVVRTRLLKPHRDPLSSPSFSFTLFLLPTCIAQLVISPGPCLPVHSLRAFRPFSLPLSFTLSLSLSCRVCPALPVFYLCALLFATHSSDFDRKTKGCCHYRVRDTLVNCPLSFITTSRLIEKKHYPTLLR